MLVTSGDGYTNEWLNDTNLLPWCKTQWTRVPEYIIAMSSARFDDVLGGICIVCLHKGILKASAVYLRSRDLCTLVRVSQCSGWRKSSPDLLFQAIFFNERMGMQKRHPLTCDTTNCHNPNSVGIIFSDGALTGEFWASDHRDPCWESTFVWKPRWWSGIC